MSLALVHSRAKSGVQAPAVRVEVYLAAGLPVLNMVGLPEAAVRESRDRVRAAISCAQLEFPNRRITVNLAPADLPKDGGRFDLPLALGILAANGAIDPQALNDYEFIGELALTGELRAIDGVLPAALAAKQAGRRMIVPLGNAAEAGLARGEHLYTARTLMGSASSAWRATVAESSRCFRFHRRPDAGHGRCPRSAQRTSGHGDRGGRWPPYAFDRLARLRQNPVGFAPAGHSAAGLG